MWYRFRTHWIHMFLNLWVFSATWKMRVGTVFYRRRQLQLAQRFKVDGVDPTPYDESTRARIIAHAEAMKPNAHFAWTSGTTNAPKQILYTRKRIKRIQRNYFAQVTQAYVSL